MKKPRVIRTVTAVHKTGPLKDKAKTAKDRNTQYTVERVIARRVHRCDAGRACVMSRAPIMPDGVQTYAKVTGPDDVKYMKGRAIPEPKVYHWACLPEGAVRLRRFFFSDMHRVGREFNAAKVSGNP